MANLAALTDPNAIHKAVSEFDEIGRRAFLKKYGFGKADRYYLVLDGKYYDSKAIVGAAYGFQYPDQGPLSHRTFSGGHLGAVRALKRLDLPVAEGAPRYLVLAQNEISANPDFSWKDVTGERYHFPNSYRNRIRPGSRFIYYRGSRRITGRTSPEYFGWGEIESVYRDPETVGLPPARQAWFADIGEYVEFPRSVAFRDGQGVFRETGSDSVPKNYWGSGVREIESREFYRILRDAGVSLLELARKTVPQEMVRVSIPTVSDDLFVHRAPPKKGGATSSLGSGGGRRSARAKAVGDHAEQTVCEWLRSALPEAEADKIVWVASLGETPGYDIEDRRDTGAVLGYEVKATNGTRFLDIELTANELRAAKLMGERYFLVLVAEAESQSPQIQLVRNPAKMIEQGLLWIEPAVFRLSRR
jgi:hypothetical protein